MENNLIKKQIDNSTSKYIHPIELYALNFHFHTESEHSFIELANENEEQFAVKYLSEQSVLEMLAEKDREIERLKHRIESIKQSAEDKMNNNNDRRLSESYIEASACIDVCDDLLMLIAKSKQP